MIGRDKLRKCIKYFTSIYPDIQFTVQESSACTDSQKVWEQPTTVVTLAEDGCRCA